MHYVFNLRAITPYLGDLVSAAVATITVSLATMVVSLALGMVFAVGRQSRHRAIRICATAYVEFFRNTPLLVVLYFVYFMIPTIGLRLSSFQSALLAMSLTPALCATLLKPAADGAHHYNRGFFRWFNRNFDAGSRRYQGIVGRMIGRPWRYMLVYLALASLMGLLFLRLPTAFLPDEDQGYLFTLVQTPVNTLCFKQFSMPCIVLDRTPSRPRR